MRGDRVMNSAYEIKMHIEESCKVLCKMTYTASQMASFSSKVDEDSRVNWIVDNLPASTLLTNKAAPSQPYHVRGFPVGFKLAGPAGKAEHYLFNHVKIIVAVHRAGESAGGGDEERVRVVGFRVEPYSIAHGYDRDAKFSTKDTELTTCSATRPATNDPSNYQRVDGAGEVVFTYDVEWEDSATPWAHRWDCLLYTSPSPRDRG